MTDTMIFSQEIAELRGCFEDGYSDDDATAVLDAIAKYAGVQMRVVWRYRDTWGCGGDSEIAVTDPRTGMVHDMSSVGWEFLSEADNSALDSPAVLSALVSADGWIGARRPDLDTPSGGWPYMDRRNVAYESR